MPKILKRADRDHLIEGHFERHGQFSGIIRIHKQELQQYPYSINRPPQQKTPYGAFDIKIGYTQGDFLY